MITTLFSALVIVLFVSWAIITLLNQFEVTRRFIGKLIAFDICGLIPIWTFFAPNPGNTDVYLLYRDRDVEGRTTVWRDIKLERRKSLFTFWNPKRRIGKGVVDIAPDLTLNTNYEPQAPVSKKKVLEFPYLLLLKFVCHQPEDFRADMRQFAIARTQGYGTEGQPEVIFLSAFHRIR